MVSKIILGAFVQTRPKFGQNEENIEDAIRLASKVKSDIYVFPGFATQAMLSDPSASAIHWPSLLEMAIPSNNSNHSLKEKMYNRGGAR